MAKKTDKTTLRETWQIHWRAYKDIRHFCPGVFAVTAAHSIAKALSPYITVFFSARIINELAGLRRAEELTRLVMTALVCMAAMTLLTGLLLRWRSSIADKYTYRKYHMLADKMLSLDFADVDNPKTHDLRSQIKQSENWSGWGINQLYYRWADFVEGCAGIVGAVALTVTLFTLKVPVESSLVLLNHPGFVVLLIALVAVATTLGPICKNKSEDCWAACAEDARLGNRVFGAFGFISDDAHRAVDFRIYKQENMADHYLRETDIFSADGKMAMMAKGPMGAWAAAGASISSVLTGIVYVFVCLKAWAGAFGVGSVTQYVGAVTALSSSVSTLIVCIGTLKNNVPFMRTTYEFLDIPNAMYQGSLQANAFKSSMTYEILLIVVIGGMGSISGSVIASFLFIAASEWWLRFLDDSVTYLHVNIPFMRGGFRMVVFSVVIMLIVLFYRRGIMGENEFSWDAVLRFFRDPFHLVSRAHKKKAAKEAAGHE